jgi:hypothetical protein
MGEDVKKILNEFPDFRCVSSLATIANSPRVKYNYECLQAFHSTLENTVAVIDSPAKKQLATSSARQSY